MAKEISQSWQVPSFPLKYRDFAITEVKPLGGKNHISLDEFMGSKLLKNNNFEIKGFMEAMSITDFPIRDHKMIFKIRCRRWTDTRTGKSLSLSIGY